MYFKDIEYSTENHVDICQRREFYIMQLIGTFPLSVTVPTLQLIMNMLSGETE